MPPKAGSDAMINPEREIASSASDTSVGRQDACVGSDGVDALTDCLWTSRERKTLVARGVADELGGRSFEGHIKAAMSSCPC